MVKSINKMIANKKVLLIAAIVLLGLTGGVAYAQTAPQPTPAGSTFEQRLAQRKSERTITLDDKDIRRIESRCKGSQSTLITIQQELAKTIEERKTQHLKIDGKLWIAIGQLKIANQDTFELEGLKASYNKQVATFDDLTKEYTQAIDDTIVVNCVTDPQGFKAVVETARIYLQEVRKQSGVIRAHLLDSVKPALSKSGEKL